MSARLSTGAGLLQGGLLWGLAVSLCSAAEPALNESGGERQVLLFNDLGASLGMSAPAGHAGFAVNREFIRGFENESGLRNGQRDFGYLGVESAAARLGVEVFKGPASALYGNGKPGGDVNVLSALPDGVRRRDAQLSVDRYGKWSVQGDVAQAFGTGQGTSVSPVALRVGWISEGGPGRRRFDDIRAHGVSPSVAWRMNDRLMLTVEADVLRSTDHVAPDRLPFAPLIAFPDTLTLGEARDVLKEHAETTRVSMDYLISDTARVRQRVFVQRSRILTQASALDVYGLTGDGPLTPDGLHARRVAQRHKEHLATDVSQTEWLASFQIGGRRHEWLAGIEFGRFRSAVQGDLAPLPVLDLRLPAYGASAGTFVPDVRQRDVSRSTVLYLQDRIQWSPRWQTMTGLRMERFKGQSHNALEGRTDTGQDTLVSPRLGIVHTPRPALSWFASWTQSTRPQLGEATASGESLPHEQSRQIEAGLQWGKADEGMLVTLTVYRLDKQDLATVDAASPQFSVPGGRRRSSGMELDLRGALWRGATLDASIELLKARVVKDNEAPRGTRLPGVAPWFASVWLTQTLGSGWTAGWGLVAEGRRRAAMPPNDLHLDAYVTTDLSLAYRGDHWRLQATLANALGRRAVVSDGYAVDIVEPRALQLTLSTSF